MTPAALLPVMPIPIEARPPESGHVAEQPKPGQCLLFQVLLVFVFTCIRILQIFMELKVSSGKYVFIARVNLGKHFSGCSILIVLIRLLLLQKQVRTHGPTLCP